MYKQYTHKTQLIDNKGERELNCCSYIIINNST